MIAPQTTLGQKEVGNNDRKGAMPEGLLVGKRLLGLESASPFVNHSSFFPFSY